MPFLEVTHTLGDDVESIEGDNHSSDLEMIDGERLFQILREYWNTLEDKIFFNFW